MEFKNFFKKTIVGAAALGATVAAEGKDNNPTNIDSSTVNIKPIDTKKSTVDPKNAHFNTGVSKESTTTIMNARKVDVVPEGYVPNGSSGGKNFYKKETARTLDMAQPGGNGGPDYEKWLKKKLASGVTVQELIDKKYISPDEKDIYMPYQVLIVDHVYTEDEPKIPTTPVSVPEVIKTPPQIKTVLIDSSYIVNVRGDQKAFSGPQNDVGSYYVLKDKNAFEQAKRFLRFSSAEEGYNNGQITVNMNDAVMRATDVKTKEHEDILGKKWTRDPKNPNRLIQVEDSNGAYFEDNIVKNK